MRTGEIAFIVLLVLWLIAIVWCIYAISVFWQSRFDAMMAKRKPGLTLLALICFIIVASCRWLAFAADLWPRVMSWVSHREISLLLSHLTVVPLGMLLVKTWLCYFDWQQNLDLLNLKWTTKLEINDNPWTVRYGKYLGNVKFLCTFIGMYFVVVFVTLDIILEMNNGNHGAWSFQGAVLVFYGSFIVGFIYPFSHIQKCQDLWDIRGLFILFYFIFYINHLWTNFCVTV
ncbi:hypothetical protein RFI_28309 [Reticulomyxa filosa]|uniref:Uncharacterized protein n=1 Tax=Reticulomyxa filosa TaxID=46433 RepID=X6M6I8_RETFI|nr:hypothetical protein RFI_28309 [Reticulomyxa filosa]|eukprot:ETO09077.1 hypothetical protein RFI_28309 [Reticulomyxa filosa]